MIATLAISEGWNCTPIFSQRVAPLAVTAMGLWGMMTRIRKITDT